MKTLSIEQKYRLYEKSVQNCKVDIKFINKQFKKIRNRTPLTLEEGLCGSAALSYKWIQQSPFHCATALDINDEPLEYGKKRHGRKLNREQRKRLRVMKKNVLSSHSIKSDVATAFNFSHFTFRKRKEMLKYFKRVRQSLTTDGIFFTDIFGGSECNKPLEEKTKYKRHSYYWDCASYNPINSEAIYHIHFKARGRKYRQVFSYHWRMWTPQEIVELMEEAKFSQVMTYWEGEGKKGDGNGLFFPSNEEEQCDSWISYIVGLV